MQSKSYENALYQRPLRSHFRCQRRLSRFHEQQLHPLKSDGRCRQTIFQVRRGRLSPNLDSHLMRQFYQTLQMLSDNSRTWDTGHPLWNQRHPKQKQKASLVTSLRRLQEPRLSVTDLTNLGIDSLLWQQLRVGIQCAQSTLIPFSVTLIGAVLQLVITKKSHPAVLSGRSPRFVGQQQAGHVAFLLRFIELGLHLCLVQSIHGSHHMVCGLNMSLIPWKAHLIPKPRRMWSRCNREFLSPDQERRFLKSDLMSLRRSVCWCAKRLSANTHTDWPSTPINCTNCG